MKKIAIVYASQHHGNTRRLVERIAEQRNIQLFDAEDCRKADLSEFELIGFASGIDFGRFYDPVIRFLKENLPEGKKVFFLYTCARVNSRFTDTIAEAAAGKNAVCLGAYGCRGYNTYGPWKLIGGMNKHHPDAAEILAAVRFVDALCTEKS